MITAKILRNILFFETGLIVTNFLVWVYMALTYNNYICYSFGLQLILFVIALCTFLAYEVKITEEENETSD